MSNTEVTFYTEEEVHDIGKMIINAFLLAMNDTLGIGSVRGLRVVNKVNEIMETKTYEEIQAAMKELK